MDTPTSSTRDPATVRRDLGSIVCDGSAFSLMMGVGELYLPAFVLALGMGEVTSGLITTVPLLAGAMLQLVSPAAVRRLGSARLWVVLCAAAQAVSFVPLVIAALVGSVPTIVVFLIAAWYWGAGMATGPAWSTWVETLVPLPSRARYFARRTRFMQAAQMTGFVGGGLALHWGEHVLGQPLTVFAALFLIAGLARAASTVFLALQSEPQPPNGEHRIVPIGEFFSRLMARGDGRALFYFMLVQAAAQIAAPYFTPYMLKQLEFPYGTYVLLIATSYLAKSISLPFLGSLAQRYGTRWLLRLGGVVIVPLSALWLVSANPIYLFFVQVAAGVAWASYELSMFLMLFESTRPEERTSVLTMFNVGHAAATVAGSLLGGAVLMIAGKNPSAYLTIFALSSLARFLTLPVLARVPRPAHEPLPVDPGIAAPQSAEGPALLRPEVWVE